MPTIEERRTEQLLEQIPYARAVLIPVNDDGSLANVAVKNMDWDQAMIAAWSLAVGIAQNRAEADQSQVVKDAMTQEVGKAKKRLYVAGGDVAAMRRAGQIGDRP